MAKNRQIILIISVLKRSIRIMDADSIVSKFEIGNRITDADRIVSRLLYISQLLFTDALVSIHDPISELRQPNTLVIRKLFFWITPNLTLILMCNNG